MQNTKSPLVLSRQILTYCIYTVNLNSLNHGNLLPSLSVENTRPPLVPFTPTDAIASRVVARRHLILHRSNSVNQLFDIVGFGPFQYFCTSVRREDAASTWRKQKDGEPIVWHCWLWTFPIFLDCSWWMRTHWRCHRNDAVVDAWPYCPLLLQH